MSEITDRDIEALIQSFDQSSWREMHLVVEGLDLYLSKDPSRRSPPVAAVATAPASAPIAATAPIAAAPVHAAGPRVPPEGLATVRAPNLGTFYRSPKPGAEPYVSIGQEVAAETEICLIEVMKLFTPVRAGMAGIVREILAADSQLVEFDQPLFLIEPKA